MSIVSQSVIILAVKEETALLKAHLIFNVELEFIVLASLSVQMVHRPNLLDIILVQLDVFSLTIDQLN